MWLKAMDIAFDKLKVDGLDFSTVSGISGCAQQHGSVWWRKESATTLANLNPDEYLHKALQASFALRESPIWMDSSTSEECRLLESRLGGPDKLAQITGSRAYERFTGPQIAKIIRKRPEVFAASERITLISNFLASLLCGAYAPFDASDASGMNMLDLRTKRWSQECLEAILGSREPAALTSLLAKLGCLESSVDDNIVDTHEVVGRIARYFVERYGFPPECLVSSFTGDNPASLAGLCMERGDAIISLGTSDTIFFPLHQPQLAPNGHILRSPLDETGYMGMVVFKNGSRTRERIRDKYAAGSWREFSRLLDAVPRGNLGQLAFYWDHREIYPLCVGDFRFNKLDQPISGEFGAPEFEVRACLEHQFMRLYLHSRALGLDLANLKRVLVTGGASTNKQILQVIADIFRKPVYTLAIENSAPLGAAYLAKYAYELEQQKLDQSFSRSAVVGLAGEQQAGEKSISFTDMVKGSEECERSLALVCEPTPIGSSLDLYESLLSRYAQREAQFANNNQV